MILARLSKAVREQKWFAVVLELFIVLSGVGLALAGDQYLSKLTRQADLERLEPEISLSLFNIYRYSSERYAIRACRNQHLTELTDQLLGTEGMWDGDRWRRDRSSHFSIVWIDPNRPFVIPFWAEAANRGTLDVMDPARREEIDYIFRSASQIEQLQDEILILQASLSLLSRNVELSQKERHQYCNVIAEIDGHEVLIATLTGDIFESFRNPELDFSFSDEERENMSRYFAGYTDRLVDRYGECVIPVQLPGEVPETAEAEQLDNDPA